MSRVSGVGRGVHEDDGPLMDGGRKGVVTGRGDGWVDVTHSLGGVIQS